MSTWLTISLWTLAGVMGLFVLIGAARNGRPVRSLLSSGTQGLCALGLVNLLSGFTGVALGAGWLAAGVSFALGIPGVIGLLVVKAIFGV